MIPRARQRSPSFRHRLLTACVKSHLSSASTTPADTTGSHRLPQMSHVVSKALALSNHRWNKIAIEAGTTNPHMSTLYIQNRHLSQRLHLDPCLRQIGFCKSFCPDEQFMNSESRWTVLSITDGSLVSPQLLHNFHFRV